MPSALVFAEPRLNGRQAVAFSFAPFAGAAGIVALDAVTYLDMVVRGRSASEVPAKTAERLAECAGLHDVVSGDGPAANRRSGLGALMGYAAGLGSGLLYGVVRGAAPKLPGLGGAVALTALTLLLGEGTATKVGATNWATWSPGEWVADLIPRAAYGATTALVFEALDERPTALR